MTADVEPFSLTAGIEDRGIIVTGAARGVGRATARLLAASGARVCAVDIDADGLATLADELADPDRHVIYPLDLRDVSAYDALVAHAEERLGGVYGLAHVAGLLVRRPLEDVSEDDWDLQSDVNLKSAFFLSKAAAGAIARSGDGGRIVLFSTGSWVVGPHYGSHAYVAAKSGLIGMTRGFARAYGPQGILVNVIAPGQVDTPLQRDGMTPEKLAEAVAACPLGRMGTPEELASVVTFLCSRHASFVNGATLNVSGGLVMY